MSRDIVRRRRKRRRRRRPYKGKYENSVCHDVRTG